MQQQRFLIILSRSLQHITKEFDKAEIRNESNIK
jgi:hypothetical protein